jgi:site-specific DNA-methyltransferase (adenine-specific)
MPHAIPFSDLIILPNRQRRDFDPETLTDLANSISSLGLLHPIVVRETPEGLVLVAGERRLRALETIWLVGDGCRHNGRDFGPNEVPYVTLGELSPLEAEEAELDENLKRRDLTWQERSEALSRLHRLRHEQAALVGQSHQIADTLREIETTDYSTDRKAILLADHLSNPLVAGAKNEKEAFKVLKRQEDRAKSEALAEAVGATYNSAAHQLHHVDCLAWLAECPDNQFDVILTDPPYGMNAQAFGDGGGKMTNSEHHYDDSPQSWWALMNSFCSEAYRVAKPQAHAYIFCDFDKFHELKGLMQAADWYVFRTPLIVHKLGSGRVPLPEHGPRRQYECILYAIKGNRPVTGIYPDVIPCKLEENLTHGANKPVELYVDLLKRSTRPGDTVLDAFAGSGTIFPAAHHCKLYSTGLELNAEYYGICVNRLNALDDQPAMI